MLLVLHLKWWLYHSTSMLQDSFQVFNYHSTSMHQASFQVFNYHSTSMLQASFQVFNYHSTSMLQASFQVFNYHSTSMLQASFQVFNCPREITCFWNLLFFSKCYFYFYFLGQFIYFDHIWSFFRIFLKEWLECLTGRQ